MTNSLFHDVLAAVDKVAAATGITRVRDLISIGQVMQHVVDSSLSPYEESPQGCGDDVVAALDGAYPAQHPLLGGFVPMSGGSTNDPSPYEYDEPEGGTWLWDEYGIPYWTSSGDVVEATVSGPVVCDIEADEAAELQAALSSYLRTLNMGTWLTSQPRRFGYTTPAYRGSSR